MKWPKDHHAPLQISTEKKQLLALTSMSKQDDCSREETEILIIINIQEIHSTVNGFNSGERKIGYYL